MKTTRASSLLTTVSPPNKQQGREQEQQNYFQKKNLEKSLVLDDEGSPLFFPPKNEQQQQILVPTPVFDPAQILLTPKNQEGGELLELQQKKQKFSNFEEICHPRVLLVFPSKNEEREKISEQNPLLDALPSELLYEIFRAIPELSAHDLLLLSLVCVRFCCLAQSPTAWRSLANLRWGTDPFIKVPKEFDWKLYHREKCAFDRPFPWVSLDDIEPHPPPRQSHGTTRVGNKLLIVGGHQIIDDRFQRQNDIWTYDTTTKVFEQVQPIQTSTLPALSRHRLVTLDNKIYSFGGILQDKKKLNSIFKFDPETLTWEEISAKGQTPEPRCDSVVVVHRRKIVVFGGSVQDLVFPSDLHVFDIDTQTWSQPPVRGEVPPARIGCTGAVVGDTMYLYGGGDYDKDQQKYKTLFTEVWALDLKKFEWSRVPTLGEVPSISDFLNVFVIGNHLVIEGGWYSEPYAFDTVGKRWRRLTTTTPDGSKVNNNDASATLIGNAVYYFGGYFNVYRHHLYKLDVSSLSFLLGGEGQCE